MTQEELRENIASIVTSDMEEDRKVDLLTSGTWLWLAQAWDSGFDEASDDIGRAQFMADFGESPNPYRSPGYILEMHGEDEDL